MNNELNVPSKVYLNGKEYKGEATFINGYNGYTRAKDDAILCALIDNSCWGNKVPNYLTDKNGKKIEDINRRGITINIK